MDSFVNFVRLLLRLENHLLCIFLWVFSRLSTPPPPLFVLCFRVLPASSQPCLTLYVYVCVTQGAYPHEINATVPPVQRVVLVTASRIRSLFLSVVTLSLPPQLQCPPPTLFLSNLLVLSIPSKHLLSAAIFIPSFVRLYLRLLLLLPSSLSIGFCCS